jgi:voltage-gated potassium channel
MSAIGEEFTRLRTVGEHHRRLAARIALVVSATLLLDLVGSVAMFYAERHAHGTQIRTIGQSLFFCTTQLLTVSSSLTNPLTPLGRLIDALLELWAVLVVAGSAGAIASFFRSCDTN